MLQESLLLVFIQTDHHLVNQLDELSFVYHTIAIVIHTLKQLEEPIQELLMLSQLED